MCQIKPQRRRNRSFSTAVLGLVFTLMTASAWAGPIEVFHADSLAGPMKSLKAAFETKNPGITVNLTSGRSQELAERILKGTLCDVFAPSAPAVIEKDLMTKNVAGTSRKGADWSAIFSANEMVLITAKGNPKGIKRLIDLTKAGHSFTRITGEKDLGTQRTIDFIWNVVTFEGRPDLALKLINEALVDPAKPQTVPDTIAAVKSGKADAGVVYYSAAVAAKADIDILRFPAMVNLSSQILNALTVPATAKNSAEGLLFAGFILSPEGQKILEETGQPAIVPALLTGEIPAGLK
ncbi:MAG: extracellular solute-binding protein [Smithellaceae bacterium]|nr:extracellular solute-binding protein [Smithellaceae bacterium]